MQQLTVSQVEDRCRIRIIERLLQEIYNHSATDDGMVRQQLEKMEMDIDDLKLYLGIKPSR